MQFVKTNAMFAFKVIATLAVTAIVLNLVGINLFALISSPVATIKALVTPKAAATA